MKSLLEQLYDGELRRAAHPSRHAAEGHGTRPEDCPQYSEFLRRLEALDPALAETFLQIMEEAAAVSPMGGSGGFVEGFRLGARMMIEVYEGSPSDPDGVVTF